MQRKEYFIEYRKKNKKRSNAYANNWRKKNPHKVRERLRRWTQTPKGIYHALKQHSRVKNRPFDLQQLEFIIWHNSQEKKCYYCSKPQGKKRLSIDRKNNNLFYSLDNIVLACDECNSVKGNVLTEQEMLIVGKLIMEKRWQTT